MAGHRRWQIPSSKRVPTTFAGVVVLLWRNMKALQAASAGPLGCSADKTGGEHECWHTVGGCGPRNHTRRNVALPKGSHRPKEDSAPKLGEMIIQTIPATHYVFGSFDTDFKGMVGPVVKTLTALRTAGKDDKVGLYGPVLHYYYGAPHQAPDKTFRMETGFFVSEGVKTVGSFQVRELPKFN